VAKKKNSVALFEVIQKTKRSDASMDVPKWMGGQGPKAPAPAVPERPGAARPAASPAEAGGPERLVTVTGDRLRLSLNYTTAAIAIGVLVVLVLMGFAIGRYAGGRGEPAKQGTMAERTPYSPDVVGGPKPAPAEGTRTGTGTPVGGDAAADSAREKGKWYLVIQGLGGTRPADLEEAWRITTFCKANGVPAKPARYTAPSGGKQRYIVWSLVPFDSAKDEKAWQYARKVEAVGKEYFAKYTTYDFRQRMAAGGKFNPWFELYR